MVYDSSAPCWTVVVDANIETGHEAYEWFSVMDNEHHHRYSPPGHVGNSRSRLDDPGRFETSAAQPKRTTTYLGMYVARPIADSSALQILPGTRRGIGRRSIAKPWRVYFQNVLVSIMTCLLMDVFTHVVCPSTCREMVDVVLSVWTGII
jgi:hypothetical protein